MGADSFDSVVRAAEFLGIELSETQRESLAAFHDWLTSEATQAGGIGPHEQDRLWNRHIADSLLFGSALALSDRCVDIGTGVGLPGIPLAIAYPEAFFVLVDRAGRRCDMAKRAVGVLRLANCAVLQRDVHDLDETYGALVSRAAIPPSAMMIHVKRLLEPGGVALLGLSRRGSGHNPVPSEPGFSVTTVSIPAEVLDTGVNLLRIEAT